MKPIFLLFLALISLNGFGQISGIVKDSVSGEAIPYVNIWIENKEIGTSSDKDGRFTINDEDKDATLVFSAVGYTTKKEKCTTANQPVYLIPKVTELPEVVVSNRQHSETYVIGSIKRSQIKSNFGANDKPWIVAKFFPYETKYAKTPFLKSIRFSSDSKTSGAIVNVRLYDKGEDGKPGNYLTSENILVTVPKGKKIVTVNLEEYHISFPSNGFFIGFERLIIGKNRYVVEYTEEGDKTRKKYFENFYAPGIGFSLVNTNHNSWLFSRGNWINYPSHPDFFGDKVPEAAVEITLTN